MSFFTVIFLVKGEGWGGAGLGAGGCGAGITMNNKKKQRIKKQKNKKTKKKKKEKRVTAYLGPHVCILHCSRICFHVESIFKIQNVLKSRVYAIMQWIRVSAYFFITPC
jgi:hypothetical protein